MKKVHKIIILIVIVLIIIGVVSFSLFNNKSEAQEDDVLIAKATKTINCVLENNYGNYSLNGNYDIYSKDGIVLYVDSKEIINAKSKELLEFQRKVLKVTYESSRNLYGGYDIKILDEDNKAIFNVKIDYTKMNIERYLQDQIALKKYYKNNGIEDIGVKNYYESKGAICEEK